ncbi:MAG: hypothetical protein HDKAJFGB_01656 [Anaerolineae bacterium]|nr:hypothetical protein [Anaerolineae bacterium]
MQLRVGNQFRLKLADARERLVGITDIALNTQTDIQAVRFVTEPRQHIPQRERILAAADRDQHAFVALKHFIFFNRALRGIYKPLAIMFAAQREFVMPHVHDGGFVTFTTTHLLILDFGFMIYDFLGALQIKNHPSKITNPLPTPPPPISPHRLAARYNRR